MRTLISERAPLDGGTRVFLVGEAEVWWYPRDARAACAQCSSPLVAMSASCRHARTLKRHLSSSLDRVVSEDGSLEQTSSASGPSLAAQRVERRIARMLQALERAFPRDGTLVLRADGQALHLHRRHDTAAAASPEAAGELIASFAIKTTSAQLPPDAKATS